MRSRPTLMTECEYCHQETKCYLLFNIWLCETCFDMWEGTL